MPRRDPLLLAMEQFKRPGPVRRYRPDELTACLELLRIAAGDEQALDSAAARTLHPKELLEAAVRNFLRMYLADPALSGHATLLLEEDASPELVTAHKRWLLKWLHPDRNTQQWEVKLFHKVSKSFESLQAVSAGEVMVLAGPVAGKRPRPARAHRSRPRRQLTPRMEIGVIRNRALKLFGALAIISGLMIGYSQFQFGGGILHQIQNIFSTIILRPASG